MDESRKEELFSAIYMAAQFGYHLAARKAFEASMEETVSSSLERIIKILEQQQTIKLAKRTGVDFDEPD